MEATTVDAAYLDALQSKALYGPAALDETNEARREAMVELFHEFEDLLRQRPPSTSAVPGLNEDQRRASLVELRTAYHELRDVIDKSLSSAPGPNSRIEARRATLKLQEVLNALRAR